MTERPTAVSFRQSCFAMTSVNAVDPHKVLKSLRGDILAPLI